MLANSGKSSRRSRRRRRRRRPRPQDENVQRTNQKQTSRRNVQVDKSGELPQAFIYTYTIYKAVE